jgi:tol-pal system protein YbgF
MRLLAPVALALASTACFATRNDVRILQGDVFALRTQQAQADSARARQLAGIASTLSTTLDVVRDSVRVLSDRLTSFQGATRQDMYSIGQQLLGLGELMGQSQAQLLRFKAEIEDANNAVLNQMIRAAQPADVTATPPAGAGAPSRAPGDTTPPPIVPPEEGPNVLYQIGMDQLMQRGYSSAREVFDRIVTRFPESDVAPDATLRIAEAFGAEGRVAESDSVFRVVFEKWPSAESAAPAMYKLGLSLDRQGKRAEARAMMQQVVRNYPRSDSYTLASDWLKANP